MKFLLERFRKVINSMWDIRIPVDYDVEITDDDLRPNVSVNTYIVFFTDGSVAVYEKDCLLASSPVTVYA